MYLVGLSYAESVLNSEITGNVFTDIGSAAFVLGRSYHSKFTAPTQSGPSNIMFRAGWTSSYNYTRSCAASFFFLNQDTGNEFYTSPSYVWYNEPWAQEMGIKSWIKIDCASYKKEQGIIQIFLFFTTGEASMQLKEVFTKKTVKPSTVFMQSI
jgi:hypothetical protein